MRDEAQEYYLPFTLSILPGPLVLCTMLPRWRRPCRHVAIQSK